MKKLLKTTVIVIIMGFGYAVPVFAQSDALFIDTSGRVGIGTRNPQARLNVIGDIYTSCHDYDTSWGHDRRYRGSSRLGMKAGTDPSWGFTGMELTTENAVKCGSGSGGIIKFYTWGCNISGDSEVVRIDELGNVGIGDKSPSVKLSVNGDIKASGMLTAGNITTTGALSAGSVTTTGALSAGSITTTGALSAGNTTTGDLNAGLGHFYKNIGPGPGGSVFSPALGAVGIYLGWNLSAGYGEVNFLNGTSTDVPSNNHHDLRGGFTFDNYSSINNSYSRLMTIDGSGKVGIGTNSPQAPLEVAAYNCNDNANYTIKQCTIPSYTWNQSPDHISILADGDIWGYALYQYSDIRIKNDIKSVQLQKSLALINNLNVVDYRYKDVIRYGNVITRGFIAQEVEEYFPQAIAKIKNFIPDIFMLADKLELEGTKLIIKLEVCHNLSNGDTVRLITGNAVRELPVMIIDANSFFVEGWDQPEVTKLFVYGKKVSDFRAINYSQIFSTSVGAIQELSKEVDSLKKENEALKMKNLALEKRMTSEEDIMTKMEARLDAVEDKTGVSKKTAGR